MTYLEVAANSVNLLTVFLASINNVHTWKTSVVACCLLAFMFFDAKLYADVILQILFVIISFYGWWSWRCGGERRSELPITSVSWKSLLALSVLASVATSLHGFILVTWTDASFPFLDSAVLSLSLLAQFLLMMRKLENWVFWILVDLIAVPVYFIKGLYLTAAVFILFLCNAVWGLLVWHRLMKAGQVRET